MLAISYAGSAVFIIFVIFLATRNMLLISYAMMGFFFAPIWPLVMGEAGNLDPENSSRIAGVMTAFCGLGGMAAPTIFGILADKLSLNASLFFVFGITVAGLLSIVIYNRKSR